MLNWDSMNWFEAFLYTSLILVGLIIDIYIVVLTIKFLRRGIRFFDYQEQDRQYRQWQAQQGIKENEKNG